MRPNNLAECSDEELGWAIHFLDGHADDLDPAELRAFRIMRDLILGRVEAKRQLDADDALTPKPLHNEGDRTDFTCNGRQMVGVVEKVYTIAGTLHVPTRFNYSIRSNGQRYYVYEENTSSPYGANDD